MRAKNKALAFRPSDKNRAYLQQLGFLDARKGTKRDGAANLSRFINECITHSCEGGYFGKRDSVTTEQLLLGYWELKEREARAKSIEETMKKKEYRRRIEQQSHLVQKEEGQKTL